MNQQPLALGVKDAAYSIGLSPWTIRKYIRIGILPFVRIGRRTLIEPAELEKLIDQGRKAATR